MTEGGHSTERRSPPALRRVTNNILYTTSKASLVIAFFLVGGFCFAEGRPDSDFWKKNFDSEPDEDREVMETIISIIVGIVVFLVVAFCVCIACICCPVCLLAKMRGRRRNGTVYRSVTENGTTVTTAQNRNGTTIVVTNPPRRQEATVVQAAPHTVLATSNPSVIAISNTANKRNKPYPVQDSVTVIPHPHMTAAGYSHQPQFPYSMMSHPPAEPYPGASDLPPPYPGLNRELDVTNNLPYNPYFTEATPQPTAPSVKH